MMSQCWVVQKACYSYFLYVMTSTIVALNSKALSWSTKSPPNVYQKNCNWFWHLIWLTFPLLTPSETELSPSCWSCTTFCPPTYSPFKLMLACSKSGPLCCVKGFWHEVKLKNLKVLCFKTAIWRWQWSVELSHLSSHMVSTSDIVDLWPLNFDNHAWHFHNVFQLGRRK